MRDNHRTQIGGHDGMFHTTQWTQIFGARTLDTDRRREVVGAILGRYWKPVYCYLCRKGCDNKKAKDLTQGFFQEVVLDRDLIQQADREKGKFRTFLLSALDRWVVSEHRVASALKRSPEHIASTLVAAEWQSARLPCVQTRRQPDA